MFPRLESNVLLEDEATAAAAAEEEEAAAAAAGGGLDEACGQELFAEAARLLAAAVLRAPLWRGHAGAIQGRACAENHTLLHPC